MLKAFALKILLLFSASLPPGNIDLPLDDSWTKIDVKSPYNGYYYDVWENTELIKSCRLNPSHYLNLPPIQLSLQDLWSGGNLIDSIGNVREDLLESIYLSKSIPCLRVINSDKLSWKVYRLSPIQSKITKYPWISSKKLYSSTYGSIIYFISALLKIGLCIFALTIFKSKINSQMLMNYVGSSFFTAMYGLTMSLGVLGFGLNIRNHQFLPVLFLLLGVHFMARFLCKVKYLPKFMNILSLFSFVLLSFIAVLFYNNLEIFSLYYYLFCFPIFIIYVLLFFLFSLLRFHKNSNLQSLLLVVASSLLLVFGVNDILNSLNLISSVFLVQISFLFLSIVMLLFFEEKFGIIIFQRNKYKSELDQVYQEKLDYIAKNTVSHTIANTVQLIAHDIKKPFAMTKIVFNKLKSGKENYRNAVKLCSHVESSMEHVDHLLENLMLSREGYQNKLEPLSLHNIVQKSWDSSLKIEGHEFTLEISSDLKIFADNHKVSRLLINLFNNAKEAMVGNGKKIWVRSKLKQEKGRFFVETTLGNEGSFINQVDRENIFSQGFTKGKAEGTGLGLAICYEVVASHGGQIRCESDKEKGTEFIFTLPALSNEKFMPVE